MSKTIIDVKHFEFRWSRITRNCCKTETGIVYSNCSNHCSRFIETKSLSSIYRDQITVLDLSRPNHYSRFIETKSLFSIYRDQITVLDLSRPNPCSRFIETKSLSLIYQRQDDCPVQHEYLQLIKTISVSRTAERICEARGNLREYHIIIQARLKTSALYCK